MCVGRAAEKIELPAENRHCVTTKMLKINCMCFVRISFSVRKTLYAAKHNASTLWTHIRSRTHTAWPHQHATTVWNGFNIPAWWLTDEREKKQQQDVRHAQQTSFRVACVAIALAAQIQIKLTHTAKFTRKKSLRYSAEMKFNTTFFARIEYKIKWHHLQERSSASI